MTMREWILKLDDFLKLTGRDILTHSGCISHDAALQKAHQEYEQYQTAQLNEPTMVEKHFVEAATALKRIKSD